MEVEVILGRSCRWHGRVRVLWNMRRGVVRFYRENLKGFVDSLGILGRLAKSYED